MSSWKLTEAVILVLIHYEFTSFVACGKDVWECDFNGSKKFRYETIISIHCHTSSDESSVYESSKI